MFKGKTSLLQNNDSCFSCPNVSFIWKDILHTYNHDVFVSKKYYIHPGFYFIVVFFFVSLHDFQSNGSLPCEASSAHTCTNTFFKEYHKHCLTWILQGFLFQRILDPLFSRNVKCVTLLNEI